MSLLEGNYWDGLPIGYHNTSYPCEREDSDFIMDFEDIWPGTAAEARAFVRAVIRTCRETRPNDASHCGMCALLRDERFLDGMLAMRRKVGVQ